MKRGMKQWGGGVKSGGTIEREREEGKEWSEGGYRNCSERSESQENKAGWRDCCCLLDWSEVGLWPH